MRRSRHAIITLILALTGCAEGNSIYHNRPVSSDRPRVVTSDAKQRNLLIFRDVGDTTGAKWRVCAEAAPDVFSALSASASLEADVASKTGKAAAAIAESAGTIERTQTINLLRESMYRTCERYLSGGLTKSAFVIQAARDQRTMLAVLAIEQLTITVRSPATILSPPGTNATVASDEAAILIKQFADEKVTAQAAEAKAEGDFAAAKQKSDCDTIATAPAADPDLSAWTACTTAKQTLAARQKDVAAASDRLDEVINATSSGGTTSAGTTAGGSSTGTGGAVLSEEAIKAVADAVRDIAMNSGFDESLMFCVGYLSTPPDQPSDQVTNTCQQVVATRFINDEHARGRLLNFNAAGTSITVGQVRLSGQPRSPDTILWAYLTDTSLAAAERKRRVLLAGRTAVDLGLIKSADEITNLASSGDTDAAARLVATLLAVDTDPASQKALAAH